jgi:type III restriction enzyme
MDLREIEKLKIHCATEHFKEISGMEVQFKQVASYDSLRNMLETVE